MDAAAHRHYMKGIGFRRSFDDKLTSISANILSQSQPRQTASLFPLSYREDFLQQIGYLPTTRIFAGTATSIDEEKAQQDFLSLSLSPPLNRRRDMPALRGPFVSL